MRQTFRNTLLRSAFSLLIAGAAAKADTFLITFDAGDPIGGLAVGSVLGNQYAATTGATFSPNGFSGSGGPTGGWATNSNMLIASSTGADVGGLGTPALVSGNLLRSFSGWLNENGDPSFLISFADPIISFSADFAGISTASSTRIWAYNGTSLLGSATAAAGSGQQTLSLSGLGSITSVVVAPGDFFDWVGVDNIAFTTAASSAVPEPSAALWMCAGVAGLVCVRRRRS